MTGARLQIQRRHDEVDFHCLHRAQLTENVVRNDDHPAADEAAVEEHILFPRLRAGGFCLHSAGVVVQRLILEGRGAGRVRERAGRRCVQAGRERLVVDGAH